MYTILIKEIEQTLKDVPDFFSVEALQEFETFKAKMLDASPVTESGAKVLKWLQENETKYNNIFSSKVVGEGLSCSSRSVSGSLRKLTEDGYVEKFSSNPVSYSLTEKGKDLTI